MLFRSNNKISFDEVLTYLEELPYESFKTLVGHYAKKNKKDFEYELDNMIALNFQARLEKLNCNKFCPKCLSVHVVKNGKRPTGIQEYKCKECGTKFTLFTGTLLEKTKYHWDLWIKVLEMTLNYHSLHQMIRVLEEEYGCKGINYKTIWNWRMKLIKALASTPNPLLGGVVQLDHIVFKASQKGARDIQLNEDKEERIEEVQIVSAIDDRGSCVSRILYNKTADEKEAFIEDYRGFIHAPAYVCSYDKPDYITYSERFKIPHYVKAVESVEGHQEIHEYILNKGEVDEATFKQLKEMYQLGTDQVDNLNNELKQFISQKMTNVSINHLQDYIGLFIYKKNWEVEHGHMPESKEDIELIIIDLLRQKQDNKVNEKEQE